MKEKPFKCNSDKRKLKCIKKFSKLLGILSGKKIAILGFVILVGLISIFSIYGMIADNKAIQIENENITIYSNQPYAPQIIEKCKEDVHCSVNSCIL